LQVTLKATISSVLTQSTIVLTLPKTELQKTLWATESGLSSVKIRCKWTFASGVRWHRYSLLCVFTAQPGAYFLKGL